MFRSFKDKLTSGFKCKDLKELSKVLNLAILRTADGGLVLNQASYVRDLLERFKEHVPATADSVELPGDPNIRRFADEAVKVKTYLTESTGESDDIEGAKEYPPRKNYLVLCSGCHME